MSFCEIYAYGVVQYIYDVFDKVDVAVDDFQILSMIVNDYQ